MTEPTGITVSGRGEVELPPDVGYLTLGVQSTAATVAQAREAAAAAATAVLDALRSGGVDARDLQTTRLSIQANHDYQRQGQPLTGYTVTNTVIAKVRQLETMSALIDAATVAGGDDARLQDIRFDIEDPAAARRDARAAAMADANAKAAQLASLGGVTLGRPLYISEGGAEMRSEGPRMFKAVAAADMSSTPVEAGTNVIRIEVQVRYAIS